jgi:hypothetical protein
LVISGLRGLETRVRREVETMPIIVNLLDHAVYGPYLRKAMKRGSRTRPQEGQGGRPRARPRRGGSPHCPPADRETFPQDPRLGRRTPECYVCGGDRRPEPRDSRRPYSEVSFRCRRSQTRRDGLSNRQIF